VIENRPCQRIDARVAHRYGLTESEFTHILGTFPLVESGVMAAARKAFCSLAERRSRLSS
jgi:hypothetical protein